MSEQKTYKVVTRRQCANDNTGNAIYGPLAEMTIIATRAMNVEMPILVSQPNWRGDGVATDGENA